uniref:Uncharacterized protein n=1 Tax=Setaria italica TaxID=4555 RepID=K3Z1N7_SETIT
MEVAAWPERPALSGFSVGTGTLGLAGQWLIISSLRLQIAYDYEAEISDDEIAYESRSI